MVINQHRTIRLPFWHSMHLPYGKNVVLRHHNIHFTISNRI